MLRPVFSCQRSGLATTLRERLLGGYDGAGSWRINAVNLSSRDEQEMVESHEGLHHELQSSTAFGLLTALSVQLAHRGTRRYALNEFFAMAVEQSRQVHETFATTLSSLVAEVGRARELLAGNAVYLAYLQDGLALVPGGLPELFRNAAIAAVLRCCMAPAGILPILERGFSAISRFDIDDPAHQPDARLNRYRRAFEASEWHDAARRVATEHPGLTHSTGSLTHSSREDPENQTSPASDAMTEVCYEYVRHVLEKSGMPSVTWADQADAADALKAAVAHVDEDLAARLNIVAERRPVLDDGLEYDRQKIELRPRLAAEVISDAKPADMVPAFSLVDSAARRYICAIWLARDVLTKQFAVALPMLLPDTVVALMIAGNAVDGSPAVRLGLLNPTITPKQLQESLGDVSLLILTSHLTLHTESIDAVLRGLSPVFVVMDLPVAWQIEDWIGQGATVRMGLTPLEGLEPIELWLAVFAVDRRPGLRFLSIGGKVGVSILVERLRRRHAERLIIDGDLLRRDTPGINLALTHILSAWHVLDQDALQ